MFENFALNGFTILGDKIVEASLSKKHTIPEEVSIVIPFVILSTLYLGGTLYLSVNKLHKLSYSNELNMTHIPVSIMSVYIGIVSLGLLNGMFFAKVISVEKV